MVAGLVLVVLVVPLVFIAGSCMSSGNESSDGLRPLETDSEAAADSVANRVVAPITSATDAPAATSDILATRSVSEKADRSQATVASSTADPAVTAATAVPPMPPMPTPTTMAPVTEVPATTVSAAPVATAPVDEAPGDEVSVDQAPDQTTNMPLTTRPATTVPPTTTPPTTTPPTTTPPTTSPPTTLASAPVSHPSPPASAPAPTPPTEVAITPATTIAPGPATSAPLVTVDNARRWPANDVVFAAPVEDVVAMLERVGLAVKVASVGCSESTPVGAVRQVTSGDVLNVAIIYGKSTDAIVGPQAHSAGHPVTVWTPKHQGC